MPPTWPGLGPMAEWLRRGLQIRRHWRFSDSLSYKATELRHVTHRSTFTVKRRENTEIADAVRDEFRFGAGAWWRSRDDAQLRHFVDQYSLRISSRLQTRSGHVSVG